MYTKIKAITILTFSILLASCSVTNHDAPDSQKQTIISSFSKISSSQLMGTLDIKWNEMVSYDADEFLAKNENLEIPIGKTFIEVPTNDKNHRLLVVDSGNHNYKFFVTKFIPVKTLDKELDYSLLNKDNFSGFIDLINVENEVIDLGYFIEGNLVSIDSNSDEAKSKMAVDCYVVTTEHWTDWYVNGSYVDSTLDDITRETVCLSGGGGSGGDGGTGGSTGGTGTGGTSTDDQTVIDTKIIQKELSELEGIYRDLMSAAELDIYENDLSLVQKFHYLSSALDATHFMVELFPNVVCRSGMADAYRHALWNAFSTQRIGFSLKERLTTAHESIPLDYPLQTKEIEMDLLNNGVGRNIGDSSYAMKDAIMNTKNALYNGDLVYLTNIDPGSCRATHRSSLIPTHN